jgi:transcriptional regulator with XRE-family HTH domain
MEVRLAIWQFIGQANLPYGSGRSLPAGQSGRMSGQDLRRIRKSTPGMTLERLAEAMGVSVSQLSRIERGLRRPRVDEISRAAEVLNVSVKDLYPEFGAIEDNEKISKISKTTGAKVEVSLVEARSISRVHVRGETAAGRWFEHDDLLDEAISEDVPTIPGRYAALEQFAYRVVGPSMDKKRIFSGNFVICVPYFDARAELRDGDIGIIERRRGHLIERTCKEIKVTDGAIELWPRSTDPRFQKPIVIPDRREPHASDGTEIEIVALVIGVYTPI